MNLSDLTTLGDHILRLHSRSLNLTGNRSIYNAGDLFDNLIKITAFFCNQRRVCGNATDNTHIIRFTDLINIRGINKKFHFPYPPNFYKIDSQYLLYLLYISIPYLSHLFPYLYLYFTNCYCSRIRAQ